MKKFVRRILYLGVTLIGIWGLIELQSHLMEPVVAEVKTRKFLQELSIALEQFSGPEFQIPGPPVFNRYVWTRQDGDQALRVVAHGFGDLICLYFESPAGKSYRSICQNNDRVIPTITECFFAREGPWLLYEHCEPLSLRIPDEAKAG